MTDPRFQLPIIEEGDAGVILKKNGEHRLFNAHTALDSQRMTDRQIEQGRALIVFTALLQSPQLMAHVESILVEAGLHESATRPAKLNG